MDIQKYKRGQIWWLLDPEINNSNYVQKGSRPAVIVSNENANLFSNYITVLPCTSQEKKDLPTHLAIKLNEDTTILAECITTVEKRRLGGYIGTINDELIPEIDNIIKIALGLIDISKEEIIKNIEDTIINNIEIPSSNNINEPIKPTLTLDKNKDKQIKASKRGKRLVTFQEKLKFVNDYNIYGPDFMLKKYKIDNRKALNNRLYNYRKAIKEAS